MTLRAPDVIKKVSYINSILMRNRYIWDDFTRKEEYLEFLPDEYGRYSFYNSKYKDIKTPLCSKYLMETFQEINYPDGKKFAACLTHDVDLLNLFNLKFFKPSISNRYFYDYVLRPLRFLSNQQLIGHRLWEPWVNFKDIIKLEQKYGANSTFFLMAISEDEEGYNYDINNLGLDISYILDNDCSIGLHGGFLAFANLEKLREEKNHLEEVIGDKVIGYRNHYLRFKVPETWLLLHDSGFKYDSTLAFPECVGFRGGMCHPFKPINLYTNKAINIFEIPLVVMDSTLFSYMKLDIPNAWEILKELVNVVERYSGVLTICWHNSPATRGSYKLYEKLLKYLVFKDAWLVSADQLWYWWNKNNPLNS